MTTARKKKNSGALDISGYQHNPKLSITQRAAHYLDWSAREYPKQFTPYNLLVKAIMGFGTTPRLDSDAVNSLRSNMQRVKHYLVGTYGRELVSEPGVGVRATTDDADLLTTSLPVRLRRLQGAQKAVANTASLIDPTKIPDTPEMLKWKKWFKGDVKAALQTINATLPKLLTPAQKQDTTPVVVPSSTGTNG